MQYIENFYPKHKLKVSLEKKIDILNISAQNIDCGYTLELMSTHNLCFGSKIRKIDIPLHTPVLLYKNEVQWGIQYKDMFSFSFQYLDTKYLLQEFSAFESPKLLLQ